MLSSQVKSFLKVCLSNPLIRGRGHHLWGLMLEGATPPQWLIHKFLLSLELDPAIGEGKPDDITWSRFEPIYIAARRRLYQDRRWRYGSLFIHDNVKPVINKLAEENLPIKGKVYCDLGCGREHPYGTSAIMYLNGASAGIATDLEDTDAKRAAEALYELLIDCLAHPDDYHLSSVTREEYLSRIYSFNLKALREGDLKTGLDGVPLKFVVTNIYDPAIELESIDIMSSRAVLEHFLDFDLGCKKLYSLMAPGGVAYHHIDLADHRAYRSLDYHWWSFLGEDEQWSDGYCNRLRSSEIRKFFEKTGFEILSYEVVNKLEMPGGFRKQLKGRFATMSDEELSVLLVNYVIKKPEKVT